MKKILLIFLTFSFKLNAQVPDEVHEKCKDVADYVGCVQIFTGSVITKKETGIPEVKELKKALSVLPSRLENTSLRDFSIAIQPFTDALASAQLAHTDEKYSVEEKIEIITLTNASMRIEAAIQFYRDVWSMGIEIDSNAYPSVVGSKYVNCSRYDFYINAFNKMFESNVINYWDINLRAFNAECLLNEGGRPIYRKYEGEMLYWIKEAIKEINKNSDFPNYPFPYKTLEELSFDFLKSIDSETKEDINKYKKLNKDLESPYVLSNTVKDYSKREFRKFSRDQFNKMMVVNIKQGEFINEGNGIAYYLGGVNIEQRNEGKEALRYLYSVDYSLATKNNWYPVHFPGFEKLARIMQHTNSIGEYYYGAVDGDKMNNLNEAKKLFIATLAIDFLEECIPCYDKNGMPVKVNESRSYWGLLLQRNVAKKYLSEIEKQMK
tara:strand:- start:67 stop:1374 length:1308 start_codon:yes stop_codon:yes gene_type:complete